MKELVIAYTHKPVDQNFSKATPRTSLDTQKMLQVKFKI